MYVYVSYMCSVPEEAWGSLELQLHVVGSHHVGYWELILDPLQEQPVPSTTKPPLKPLNML